jgi:hypothetical protein
MNQEYADRLLRACNQFGWGPTDELPEFYRNDRGWQLGNGTVTAVWRNKTVPDCPLKALEDIEADQRHVARMAFGMTQGL